VLVGHFCSHFSVKLPAFVSNMAPMAVAWFFVLSGFIIAHNYPVLDNGKARLDCFLLRVARLWPVHAAILTFGIAFGMFYPSAQWLLFHYTMTQSWSLSPDIAGGYNGPAWSISVELFFTSFTLHLLHPNGGLDGLSLCFSSPSGSPHLRLMAASGRLPRQTLRSAVIFFICFRLCD
jgi:peptidoglycan/LPS O-acetylase OafA/YrhL